MSGVLGVCSWSLVPESPADLIKKILATGCDAVQLALDPIRRGEWDEDETFSRLGDAGICVLSGMMEMAGEDYSSIDAIGRTGGVRPDSTWAANSAAGRELAELAGRRHINLVTFHAGFLPHDPKSEERQRMLYRLRRLAEMFQDSGVNIGLETGQEDADTLFGILEDLSGFNVGVNFDPANMLLYGSGDPVESLRKLAAHVVQIHVKDAKASPSPKTWGNEVVVGEGEVDWISFFDLHGDRLPGVDLMIEREAGSRRVDDINAARLFVEKCRRTEGSR